jgi:hypothetical protein
MYTTELISWPILLKVLKFYFRIIYNNMFIFGSSLPPVVCRRVHVLFTLYPFVCILRCIFALFFSVVCSLCCQFLWIFHLLWYVRYYLTFIYILYGRGMNSRSGWWMLDLYLISIHRLCWSCHTTNARRNMPRLSSISSTILYVHYTVSTGIIHDNDKTDWQKELSETIKCCVTAGFNTILIYIDGTFWLFWSGQ